MNEAIEELKMELMKKLESDIGEKVSTLQFRFMAVFENHSVMTGNIDLEVPEGEGKVLFHLQGEMI